MASSGHRDFGIERAFLGLESRVLERERQLAEQENRAADVDRQVSRLSAEVNRLQTDRTASRSRLQRMRTRYVNRTNVARHIQSEIEEIRDILGTLRSSRDALLRVSKGSFVNNFID